MVLMKRGARGRDAKMDHTAWPGHDWRMDGDLFLTGLSTASESVGYYVNSGFCAGWWTLQPKPRLADYYYAFLSRPLRRQQIG